MNTYQFDINISTDKPVQFDVPDIWTSPIDLQRLTEISFDTPTKMVLYRVLSGDTVITEGTLSYSG